MSSISPEAVSERKLKAVTYDSQDHMSVLCQMHGSVWPKVLPFCIANVVITFMIWTLEKKYDIDLTFSDKGESFMSILVSFLIVTRSSIAYSRYMEARTFVSDATKACRELIQHAVAFTRYDSSPKAKQWRSEVARRIIVILRTTVAVLEYQTKGQHAWKVHELSKDEKQALLMCVGKSNERSPIMLMIFLRSALVSQRECLMDPMHVNKELRLLSFSSQFVTAYHGLMTLITTPFPFPLVQMARTFLFVWVYLLPFSLVADFERLIPLLIIIFFITYGFVGLEYVSIELDDPFGDDANDFDIMGLAQVVFEDIYISIYDVDGKETATALKKGLAVNLSDLKNQIVEEELDDVPTMEPKNMAKKKNKNKHARYDSVDAFNMSADALVVENVSKMSNLLANNQRELNQPVTAPSIANNTGFLEAVFSESPMTPTLKTMSERSEDDIEWNEDNDEESNPLLKKR